MNRINIKKSIKLKSIDELNQTDKANLVSSYIADNESSKSSPINLLVLDKALMREVMQEMFNSIFSVPDENKKLTRKQRVDLLAKQYEDMDKKNILKRIR